MIGDRSERQQRPARAGILLSTLIIAALTSSRSALAEDTQKPVALKESYVDDQFYDCQAQVSATGSIMAAKSTTETEKLPLQARAEFQFVDRLLPPAGRDAFALRAIRYFSKAELATVVADLRTNDVLPDDSRLIIASGRQEGIIYHSPDTQLSRVSLDLLKIPGDPLATIGILPLEEKSIGDTWTPPDWAIQMFSGIEAVETAKLTCQLDAANTVSAKITFSGSVKGQRLGADASVEIRGTLIFDRRTSHVARSQVVFKMKSDVGTVEPGEDLMVTSTFSRTLTDSHDQLSPEIIQAVPFDPPEEQLKLIFRADPWGFELKHDRDWHLIQALFDDSSNPIALLRLVEHGSLVCQCNCSPLRKSAAGKILPLEQFEDDIKTSLGERFVEFGKREEIPVDDGRRIFRVEAIGKNEFRGAAGKALEIPMMWIYYVVANTDGTQASFVFSVEQPLVEQLAERDLDLVKSLRFFSP